LIVAEMTTMARQLDESLDCDEALVERARTGDGASFAELVMRHRDAVYTIARNMCARHRDAEDVLQQTFLAAWHDLHSLPAGAGFTTRLYRIAMKTALAHRQRDRRNPSCSLEGFLPAFDGDGRLAANQGRWPEAALRHGSKSPGCCARRSNASTTRLALRSSCATSSNCRSMKRPQF
jgi:DNA-directed RNA polymerase specialized sigma24 family protein